MFYGNILFIGVIATIISFFVIKFSVLFYNIINE
jgi:uncharacterized membrane protein